MSQVQAIANLCEQCGHIWIPKAAAPVHCPSCKSRKWNGLSKKAERKRDENVDS